MLLAPAPSCASSIRATSSLVIFISAAPPFSRMRASLREPGMGTIYGFLLIVHTRGICAGVAFCRSASSPIRPKSCAFCAYACG